jgi:hypothetical protein
VGWSRNGFEWWHFSVSFIDDSSDANVPRYVAVHALLTANGSQGGHSHGIPEKVQQTRQDEAIHRLDVFYTVLGMALPLLTRLGGHGHTH